VRTLARVYEADEADLLARFDAQQARPTDPADDPARYVPSVGQTHNPHVAPAKSVARSAASLVPPEEPAGGYHKYTLSRPVRRRRGRGKKAKGVDGGRRGPNWSAAMGAALAVVIVALVLQQFSNHGGGTKAASVATTHATTAAARPHPSATHVVPPAPKTSTTVPANEVVVTISAVSSSSWLSVTNSSGQSLFRNDLAVGQSQRFTDTKKITLIIGNAGAVKVIVNGTPLNSLGSAGQVVTVSFVPGTSTPA
jgi:hypothetical protein